VRLSGHGIDVVVPARWEASIFRLPDGEPTLHAASFALPSGDGEFGSRATAAMPRGGIFVAVTEYRTGGGLRAGHGLFAPHGTPGPLRASDFRRNALLVARPGQSGTQRFFTAAGRPFCLYVVRRAGDSGDHETGRRLAELAALLASLRVAPAGGSG
jgi:hypothetical protein